jgi:hypothetical protein
MQRHDPGGDIGRGPAMAGGCCFGAVARKKAQGSLTNRGSERWHSTGRDEQPDSWLYLSLSGVARGSNGCLLRRGHQKRAAALLELGGKNDLPEIVDGDIGACLAGPEVIKT